MLSALLIREIPVLSWRTTHIFLWQSVVRHISVVETFDIEIPVYINISWRNPHLFDVELKNIDQLRKTNGDFLNDRTHKSVLDSDFPYKPTIVGVQDVAAQRQAAPRTHLGHLGLSGGERGRWLRRWGRDGDVGGVQRVQWGISPMGSFGF